MKSFFAAIKRFFLTSPGDRTIKRVLPLIVVAFATALVFLAATITWEKTNSVSFCGLTCHTMPPQYTTHQVSVHANVTCEDCHMGRDVLGVLIPRKIQYSWQTGTAMLTNSYEYPIVAENMRPALDACENCHEPETFTSDKLVEIKRYAEDESNSVTSTHLVVKIGGGTQREGLGFGIHWHVENPVYFYSTDRERQNIPYILVTNPDGTTTEYVDVESGFDPATINPDELQQMDCITCHNRVAHGIDSPSDAVDDMLARGLISTEIPNIKKVAVEKLNAGYESEQEALDSIASLEDYYQTSYAEFASTNSQLIDQAVQSLQDSYRVSHFPEQEMFWQTHPDNAGHVTSPGCFRCHDGSHLNPAGESVRLECNLCHSIPVVSEPNQINTVLQLNRGFEPESHKNANWIALHRTVFDDSCQACHTVEDPGGTSDQSFCSNSACHGSSYEFAGFDAPGLFEILSAQAAEYATPTPAEPTALPTSQPARPTPTRAATRSAGPTPEPEVEASPTSPAGQDAPAWDDVAGFFTASCTSCHGAGGMGGLDLSSYDTALAGGADGAVIIPGDADASPLIQVQTAAQKHFGQLSEEELEIVRQWIEAGAPE